MTSPATRSPAPPNRAPRAAVAVGLLALALAAAGLAGVLGGALSGPDTAASGAVRFGAVLCRAGADVLAVACVGGALVGVLLGRSAAGRPVSASADRVVVVAAGAWLVLVVLGIALRAADALGRSLSQLSLAEVTAWSTRLTAGRGMLGVGVCALVVLGCAVARLRRPGGVPVVVPLAVALVGAVLPSVTGHAGAEPDEQLGVVASALHVGAAALWVGGLAVLLVLVALHGAVLDGVLPRFSTLAGDCLVVLAVSGALVAAVRLDGWSPLVESGYGRLVLVKAGLLLVLTGLGGLARRRLRAGRRPVLRWAGIEVAVMALALGTAAALSQTPPPGGAAAAHEHHDEAAPAAAAVDLWAVRLDPLGTVVVDGSYRILYRSDADTNRPPASTCVAPACTATWEPVLTDERPAAGHGIAPELIGTLTRPDGTRQVTLDGWPLYRRVGEAAGFTATGSNGADGQWFAVTPDGAKATDS